MRHECMLQDASLTFLRILLFRDARTEPIARSLLRSKIWRHDGVGHNMGAMLPKVDGAEYRWPKVISDKELISRVDEPTSYEGCRKSSL